MIEFAIFWVGLIILLCVLICFFDLIQSLRQILKKIEIKRDCQG